VSALLETVESGSLDRLQPKGLLLGHTLARELGARTGDEVAVVTQAADGSLGNDLFHVAGILRTGLRNLDQSLAVAYIDDLQALLALPPERIHEVALLIGDAKAADLVASQLTSSGILPQNAVAQGWGDLSPQLKDYLNLSEGFSAFIIFLVALFAAFGVLNTMMMAVFERTREIGMLGSLGTAPLLILVSILLEGLCLAAVGLVAGFGLGSLIMADLISRGWDLSRWIGEMSMIDTRMDPVLQGAWAWDHVISAGLGLVLATLLAAFFPARRAAWMNPVEALTAPTEG
jgi:ABC-type lipoprotein release transport system permease subunit